MQIRKCRSLKAALLLVLSPLLPSSAMAEDAIMTPLMVWRVAVISDMNQSYGSKDYTSALDSAIRDIRGSGVSLVLSTGDMVAGQKAGLDYQGMWDSFHTHVTRPLDVTGIPLLPSPGNHDASPGSTFKVERDMYQSTFKNFPIQRFNVDRAPTDQVEYLPGVAQNYPLNYAVTMGPALFVGLDATVPGGFGSSQYAWLEQVLKGGRHYPVKIVFGHVPLYPFAFDRATDYLASGTSGGDFAKNFENLLETHGVTYFLSGHHHVYYPGQRKGKVRYVSVPLLGTGSRSLLNAARKKETSPLGFLYIDFDTSGKTELTAIRTSDMSVIKSSTLPSSISIPTTTTTDCKNCGSFPSKFFIDTSRRTLFNRF